MNPLFESTTELSSDLEWLLQNGAASRDVLANLLVREYYSSALSLSWAVLGDLEQARQTVVQAFTTVLVNQYRYHSGENVQIWLFKIILQAAKKALRFRDKPGAAQVKDGGTPESRLDTFLQPLDEVDRWALHAKVLLGWQVAEAAELVDIDVERVEHLIKAFHREFLPPSLSSQSIRAAKTLEQALIERFPQKSLSEEDQDEIVAWLLYAAEQNAKKNLKFVRLWETLLMAVGIVLVSGLIWWLNQSLPDGSSKIARATATTKIIRATRVVLVPVTATPKSPDRILTNYTVRPGDTLESIAQVFGMAVSDLMRLNRLSGDANLNAGQSLKVLSSVRRRLPAVPPTAGTGNLPPLNRNSTPRQVVQRLASSQSLWSAIQVDASLILNGPPGYIGPPDVTYEQVWVDNLDKRSLELSGKSSTQPDWVYAASDHSSSQINRETSQRLDIPGNQLIKNDTLRAMLFPLNSDWLSSTDKLIIGPVSPYISRETLQVGVKNASGFLQAQLWIDVETGIILRELHYSGDRSHIQTADFSISRINYNGHFPDGMFNNLREQLAAGFSADTGGFVSKLENRVTPTVNSQAHQSFFAGLPPPGFNLAQARLYFRFPESFNTEASMAKVEILAGGYSLGETQFGNPWTTICARSPDGYKVAFVSEPINPGSGGAALHWFDLRNVDQSHLVSEDLVVNNFAFSADGQRLAFFGRQTGQARGAVYIYDLLSGILQRLLDRNSANSLVWSPDGNYLAMISNPSKLGNQDAWVVDVHDGWIVAHDRYNSRGDFSLDPLIPEWPTFRWRHPDGSPVQFPVTMGGLQACVLSNIQTPE
jgi:LysM repeat protein/DNA-directed RNA polymerase specialized sigma24 family protein